jgi:MinD-like ATPase involved in chromosome partitioning or flagellar assembly
MPGKVVTFYSYKGGVGRSFALANIAVLLARWGHRVLCVDWDLEAPGLHHYFMPMMTSPPTSGVIDLVDDFLAREFRPAERVTRLESTGTLDLVAAGWNDTDYVGRIQEIDWAGLYEMDFGEYLEGCRDRWTADYDYVLIDSRTGVSDAGSICTAHLPDRLVLLYTANKQSIEGAVEIAHRANVARDKLPYDRGQLTILPVLSRFDTREEYDRSEEWRRICLQRTEDLFGNWLYQSVEPEVISRHLTLPYVSYWSFGEQLPVRQESNPSADQIGFALETVAAVVAHDFDRTDLLAENRDAYVAAARTSLREYTVDIRVSSPRSTLGFASDLIRTLVELGVRAQLSLSGDRSLLAKVEDDARHLCLLVDGEVSRWQSAEVELFLHRTLGQNRRVIPLLTADADPNGLPGYLSNLRFVRISPSRGPTGVARALADRINGVTASPEVHDVDIADVLHQARNARLRPWMWEVVDELVIALYDAVDAGDDVRVQEIVLDLALAVRPRSPEDSPRVPAPALTRKLIDRKDVG